jgi:hypothetical protein
VNLFVIVQSMVVGTALLFCVVGLAMTLVRQHRTARRAVAFDLAATVVLDDGDDDGHKIEAASSELARMPMVVIADVLQDLSLGLSGEAQRRLRLVAREAGLARRIARASRKRSWRRRVQAAHLLVLFPADAPERQALLRDRHPFVRARAIDSLTPDVIGSMADLLLEAFDHESHAVRASAQHALVRSGVEGVPAVIDLLDRLHLGEHESETIVLVAEVAAQMMDRRLAFAVLSFMKHPDPNLRVLVATCLGNGTFFTPEKYLAALLVDDDAAVRAEAIRSTGRVGAVALAPQVGRALADRAWQVRRNAGSALMELDAVGRLILRCHLTDRDAFARDMALHALGRTSGQSDVHASSDRWLPA